jgi:endonuclease/exonuclease/phosphatase family metal-dependent hydrolase
MKRYRQSMSKSFLFILSLLLCSLLYAQAPVKVITYNIRYDNPRDSVNSWKYRKDAVSTLLKQHSPDIIGTQEALHNQVKDLKATLKEYDFFGVGRNDGNTNGEYTGIFYKKNRFKRLSGNHFWLSQTPSIPGKKGWDAADVRMVSWCLLQDIPSGKKLYIFNTHFDHRGEEARKESALLVHHMMDSIAGDVPVILTGDFNSEPGSQAHYILTEEKNRITLTDAGKKSGHGEATFTGFSVHPKHGKVIDYVFYSKQFSLKQYEVIQENNGRYYYSDHLPVMVELMLTN